MSSSVQVELLKTLWDGEKLGLFSLRNDPHCLEENASRLRRCTAEFAKLRSLQKYIMYYEYNE